jgi:hypothetical protein
MTRKEDTVRRLDGSYTHISARRLGSTKEIKGEKGRMSGIREHNDEKKRRQRRVSRQGQGSQPFGYLILWSPN